MNYLKRIAGFRTVPVEIGQHYLSDESWRPELMTLSKFIDDYLMDNNNSGTMQ
jgi:hypothetical protein